MMMRMKKKKIKRKRNVGKEKGKTMIAMMEGLVQARRKKAKIRFVSK